MISQNCDSRSVWLPRRKNQQGKTVVRRWYRMIFLILRRCSDSWFVFTFESGDLTFAATDLSVLCPLPCTFRLYFDHRMTSFILYLPTYGKEDLWREKDLDAESITLVSLSAFSFLHSTCQDQDFCLALSPQRPLPIGDIREKYPQPVQEQIGDTIWSEMPFAHNNKMMALPGIKVACCGFPLKTLPNPAYSGDLPIKKRLYTH